MLPGAEPATAWCSARTIVAWIRERRSKLRRRHQPELLIRSHAKDGVRPVLQTL